MHNWEKGMRSHVRFAVALTGLKEIDAYELTHASVHSSLKEVVFLGVFPAAAAHGVALSCKWSLADSYPDIDKFTRGVEQLFAETHFAYPAHSRTEGRMVLALPRDGVSTDNSSPPGTEGERGRMLSWENDGQVYATDLHSRALPTISEKRMQQDIPWTFVEKESLYIIIY